MRRRDPKADAASQADTARDEVDLALLAEGLIGLTFSVTRHALLEVRAAREGRPHEDTDGHPLRGADRSAAGRTPAARDANAIERPRHLCAVHQREEHSGPCRSDMREFLYDWHVIRRPVAEPHLPLSNNAAEQALRHGVISRTISHGTRSEEGCPVPSLSSPASSKPAAVAEHPPGSTSAPSSPPLAKACSSPRSPPSRQSHKRSAKSLPTFQRPYGQQFRRVNVGELIRDRLGE